MEIESIVETMRAQIAGGIASVGTVANSLMRSVIAARPAIRVKNLRLWSQNSLFPPKPRSLIIDSTKSRP